MIDSPKLAISRSKDSDHAWISLKVKELKTFELFDRWRNRKKTWFRHFNKTWQWFHNSILFLQSANISKTHKYCSSKINDLQTLRPYPRSFLYGIIYLNINHVVFDSFTWFHRCPSGRNRLSDLVASHSSWKRANKITLSTQFSNNRVLIQKDFGSHDRSVNDKAHMSLYSHHLT